MAFTRPPVTAADATFSAAGAAAWAAGFGVAGATAGGLVYCPTATTETTSDSLTFSETLVNSGPGLKIGTTGTTSGLTIGYAGVSGYAGIWNNALATKGVTTWGFAQGAAGDSVFNAVAGQQLNFQIGGTNRMALPPTAGEGPAITAGTAASAVSAMAISQTWNYNTAAIQGVDWTFTDTSSHASTNAFRIRGGAAGTTSLLTLSKTGGLYTGAEIVANAGSGTVTALFLVQTAGVEGRLNAGGFGLSSTLPVGWGSSSGSVNTAALDTALSRISAGVIGVGTGAAASVAGQLNLTTLSVAGVTYANRPGTPTTGMVINITDSNTATWGATVAAGGANNVLARYNGTNWTVVGA